MNEEIEKKCAWCNLPMMKTLIALSGVYKVKYVYTNKHCTSNRGILD